MKAHLDITRSADETTKIPLARTLAPFEEAAPARSWGAFSGVEPVVVGWPPKFPRYGRFLQALNPPGSALARLVDVASSAAFIPPGRHNRA